MPQPSQYLQSHSGFHASSATTGVETPAHRFVPHPSDEALDIGLPRDQTVGEGRAVTVQQLGLVAGLMERLAQESSTATGRPSSGNDDVDPSTKALVPELTDRLWMAALAENANDRVVRSLSAALATAEQGDDRNCVDALRIAMAVRLLRLRSDKQAAIEAGDADVDTNTRRVRALQKWRLKRVVEYIEQHLSGRIGLQDLAAVAGLSRMHFASQFRVATGLRPHEFLLRSRVRRAEQLLRDTPTSIVEIALTIGFQTQAHFTTVFKRFTGCTPRRWRAINQAPQPPRSRSGKRAEAIGWSHA